MSLCEPVFVLGETQHKKTNTGTITALNLPFPLSSSDLLRVETNSLLHSNKVKNLSAHQLAAAHQIARHEDQKVWSQDRFSFLITNFQHEWNSERKEAAKRSWLTWLRLTTSCSWTRHNFIALGVFLIYWLIASTLDGQGRKWSFKMMEKIHLCFFLFLRKKIQIIWNKCSAKG